MFKKIIIFIILTFTISSCAMMFDEETANKRWGQPGHGRMNGNSMGSCTSCHSIKFLTKNSENSK